MLRMFTGPVEFERRRESLRTVSLDRGSIEDIWEFLIAYPNPFKHCPLSCRLYLLVIPSTRNNY